MAGSKLDGAGVQKMKTLDAAFVQVQRLHGVVEQYALALADRRDGNAHRSLTLGLSRV